MSEKPLKTMAWRVEFDAQACSLCEICVNRCSNHALLVRRSDTTLEILFDYHLCNGCLGQALCRENCPEHAVTVSRVPVEDLPQDPIPLIAGEMATCAGCGTQFMPERKLATLLEKGKITAKPVQRYCPACRRTQLLESYLKISRLG